MKNYICLSFAILFPVFVLCQSVNSRFEYSDYSGNELLLEQSSDNSMSKFSLSLNPTGFIQFGPIINAEFGLTDDLILNTHIRFPSLGLLTYVTKYHDDGLDKLSGIAFGGGVLNFFGESKSRPYIGGMLEYHRVKTLYAQGESWEWENKDNLVVIVANGGYRFRFDGGFFINVGGYLGAAVGTYKWFYTDPSYGGSDDTPRKGTDTTPFGMVEGTIGIEF